MSEHTKEPWAWDADEGQYTIDAVEASVYVAAVHTTSMDARRIVACVNACTGLSTKALEAGALRELIEVIRSTPDGAVNVRRLVEMLAKLEGK